MGRWVPADDVRPKEIVGRRIFNKDASKPDKSTITPNLFFDTRFEQDLSFDRLGDGQPHRDTIRYLTALADRAAVDQANDASPKHFNGWIAAQPEKLKYMEFRPDPMTQEADGIDNPYHALLDRRFHRERQQAWTLSRSLLFDFQEKGQIVDPIRDLPTQSQDK